jgi:hypothetical protein
MKTFIIAILNKHKETYNLGSNGDYSTYKAVGEEDFNLVADEIIQSLQTEWVSVGDKLPENDDEVLIVALGEVVQAYLKNGIWKGSCQVTDNMNDGYVHDRDICKQGSLFDYVTHWMPLPTPPNR